MTIQTLENGATLGIQREKINANFSELVQQISDVETQVGPAGPQGPQGAAGPTGPQGPTGLTGPQGPQGVAGVDGSQGAAGPAGPQGPQGVAGPTGPQGATGPAGPTTAEAMVTALQGGTPEQRQEIGYLVSGVVPVSLNSAESAAGNRAEIMSALASSGRAVIAGKSTDVCWISQHITVGDNQTLITDGPQIKMQAGVSDYVVGTLAEETAYSPVTVNWTAGLQATVAWPGHGCAYGDAVVLQGVLGTTYRKWFDVARVIGVTDANNITIALEWLPTAAPSGAMTAKRCNRNINIRARVNHNYSSGNNGSGRTRMASVMSFLADSSVEITAENDTAKYVCLLAGAINVTGNVQGIPETSSDTLKYYGPLRNVSFGARGFCSHEDCFSIQPYEPAAFIAYMPCWGEVNGAKIVNPDAATGGGSGGIVIYGDTQFGMSGLRIEGGRAVSVGATPGLHLRFGEGNPSAELIEDIHIVGTQISSVAASTVRVQNFKARSLNFIGAKLQAPKDNTLRVLDMNNASVLRRLSFRDMTIDLGTWPSATWQAILLDGSVDSVIFDNCSIRGGASLRFLFCNGLSTVRSILFQGCDVRGIDQLVQVQTGALVAPRVLINGGYYELNTLVGSKISGVVVDVSAGTVINNAFNGVLRYDTASTSGVLVDRGMSLQGTSVALTGANGGAVELRGPNTPFALSNTALKRASGAECIAAAAAGTIPAGAPVICDGTSWYSRVNPSLIYT